MDGKQKMDEKSLEDKLENIDITLRDVIECIADGYKIETLRFIGDPANTSKLLGMYINDGFSKEILINSEQSTDSKRYVALHELTHYIFNRMGVKQDEKIVDIIAKRKFNELYYCLPRRGFYE